MGIYYQAMDHINKKTIEPPGEFSIKSPGIFHPNNPFPNMVIMANSLGNHFEIVNDCNEDIYYADGYEDVTDYFYDMLKRYFPDYDWDEGKWKKEIGED